MRSHLKFILLSLPALLAATSKSDRLLQLHGFQLAASASPDAEFDLPTFQSAHYSTLMWHWKSNLPHQGPAPGIPWSRWVPDQAHMPPQDREAPYLPTLVSLQLGDEPPLYQPKSFADMTAWMTAAQSNPLYKDTLLFTDLSGVDDQVIGRYIRAAHPDLLTFDTYPFQSTFVPATKSTPAHAGTPLGGPPASLYYDLRRYRADTCNTPTHFGLYRQTFHAVEDYGPTSDHHIAYRDPSPSELALSTFAPMAYDAKMIVDFLYNTNASSLLHDGHPTPLYRDLIEINQTAQILGRPLVLLTPLNDAQLEPTTDILFIRGIQSQNSDGTPNYYPIPSGLRANGNDPTSYITQFTAPTPNHPDLSMDSYLTGFNAQNLGPANNGLKGDAIIAWFKPLHTTEADARKTDDIYYMVVNALTSPDPHADCTQYINLDFINPPTTSLQYLDPTTGDLKLLPLTTTPVPNSAPPNTFLLTKVQNKLRLSLFLAGGHPFLFKFPTTSPFLGHP